MAWNDSFKHICKFREREEWDVSFLRITPRSLTIDLARLSRLDSRTSQTNKNKVEPEK